MKTMTIKEFQALLANAEWTHENNGNVTETVEESDVNLGAAWVSSKTDGIEVAYTEYFEIDKDSSADSINNTGEVVHVLGVDIVDEDGDSLINVDDELSIDAEDLPEAFRNVNYDYI